MLNKSIGRPADYPSFSTRADSRERVCQNWGGGAVAAAKRRNNSASARWKQPARNTCVLGAHSDCTSAANIMGVAALQVAASLATDSNAHSFTNRAGRVANTQRRSGRVSQLSSASASAQAHVSLPATSRRKELLLRLPPKIIHSHCWRRCCCHSWPASRPPPRSAVCQSGWLRASFSIRQQAGLQRTLLLRCFWQEWLHYYLEAG